ncbi:hypothetical protein HK097_008544 [Rhizophlyctis rosea]|uniref:Raptor N-terminal CASPase-like domain-containing protein n=1 Tax=Rhizophlyctis rosea TaxID=64517 RepID=A0AAD5SBR5_9FUNG|nr:hypothetical protein HK097_008544 [Rhizophlyctis rosea]
MSPPAVADVERARPISREHSEDDVQSKERHISYNDGTGSRADASELGKQGHQLEATFAEVDRGMGEELPLEEQALYTYSYYSDRRHEYGFTALPDAAARNARVQDWRMRERLKTVSVALVLCLNIAIDPPDVVKTNPCAKLECWVDPFSLPPPKALETIGRNLQTQYEVLQPRSRYRLSLDPSVEETKKLCCSLRRNAKEERILFHYNGHGVPRPTPGGEIWVFNKNYTQYIPVSIYDVQTWIGSPCIYVYDCSNAGNILKAFNRFAEQRDFEAARQGPNPATSADPNAQPLPYVPMRECIQLAACQPNELLPMTPELPADVFTCCLTTPIEIALRWFVAQNPLLQNITPDMIMKIPGRLNDRRTPLGELNWIFTAITDTIAWNVLPHDLFKKLFRQDLMVAALFRNFLLAERIMRYYHCTPMSSPQLPPTHEHSMWQAWDLAADMCLSQLPALLAAEEGGLPVDYRHSTFFAEQLTAFEVWLATGPISQKPPEQLPIVLQVLLSQIHRLRALMLLSRFLDIGPWAVNLALSVGIFPYVLKLLQSPAPELKPVLVFIWAKILAVDRSCQNDLLKDNGYMYFVTILSSNAGMPAIHNISEHRAMCAFILSIFCHGFRAGQQACLKADLLPALVSHLSDQDPLLRQWVCVCLSKFWEGFQEAKWTGMRDGVHERLCAMLHDPVPEVRAAAMSAIGTSIGDLDKTEQVINAEHSIGIAVLISTSDASPMVRRELVVTLSGIVQQYGTKFVTAAYELLEEDRKRVSAATVDERKMRGRGGLGVDRKLTEGLFKSPSHNSIYGCIWKVLLSLSVDPHPEVAGLAMKVVDAINLRLLTSPLLEQSSQLVASLNIGSSPPKAEGGPHPMTRGGSAGPTTSQTAEKPPPETASGRLTNTLKRSASFAYSLRSLAGLGGASASSDNLTALGQGDHDHQLRRNYSVATMSALRGPGAPRHRPLSMVGVSTSGQHSPTVEAMVGSDPEEEGREDGNGSEGDSVALSSSFFEWSCEYFAEPQMKVPEIEDPGSVKFNERQWRRQRNQKVVMETMPLFDLSSTSRFEEQVGLLHNDVNPRLAVFHQYEPHLAVADERDGVRIFNWQEHVRLNSFTNGNPLGSRITSMRFINEEDLGLLMTGSDEGIIRLYRNYETSKKMEMVTSWRALTDLMPTARGSGMVVEWQQALGTFLVSGDVKTIRVWDAERELCRQEIPTRSQSCITSLTGDQGSLIVAGCGDGAVRIYDRRLQARESMVMSFNEHPGWVLSARLQSGAGRELISGSVAGDVRFWDLRQKGAVRRIDAGFNGEMTSLSIHDMAPLFACGSTTQNIRVFNTDGNVLSTIRYHEGFLGQRGGAVSCLAFHPQRLIMAAATSTSAGVSLFGSDAKLENLKLKFGEERPSRGVGDGRRRV